VIVHDALGQLGKVAAPTQITFGRHDTVTSTRFAEPLRVGVKKSEDHVFEDCAHAVIYETSPRSTRRPSRFSTVIRGEAYASGKKANVASGLVRLS
jgi:hypothetical protein